MPPSGAERKSPCETLGCKRRVELELDTYCRRCKGATRKKATRRYVRKADR